MIIHITSCIYLSFIGIIIFLASHISIVALIYHVLLLKHTIMTLFVLVEHISRCRIHPLSSTWLIPINTCIEYLIVIVL